MDGPAAAGKGTIARALAERFGFKHLDTGLIYRAVGKKVLEQGGELTDAAVVKIAASLVEEDFQEEGLRTSRVAQAASQIAVIAEVRDVVVEVQRQFARREGGAILDGRDIGTVICPDADVKLFVTASAEVRAKRRFDELVARGEDITIEEVLDAVKLRDKLDSERAVAPLRQASDAILIDTSDMSIEDAVAKAISLVDQVL